MKRLITLSLCSLALLLNACSSSTSTVATPSAYLINPLAADTAGYGTTNINKSLVNPWGLAFTGTQIWISQNGTASTTFYDSNGIQKKSSVAVRGAANGLGSPSGIVVNPNLANFNGSYTIYANEDGTISGLQPQADSATVIADRSSYGAIYKGLAIDPTAPSLYAANFKTGTIDIFGPTLATPRTASDPTLPAGFAPFNVALLNNQLYVTLAKQNGKDDAKGVGNGYVDVFNLDGTFKSRLISQGSLNSPWGMAIAPSNFGDFSGKLLVGNFGDGTINAYDPNSGNFAGTLKDASGAPLHIEGLWALAVNNGVLYYTAGPDNESHGVFGTITMK